jgi:hypothetical protein
MKRYQNINIKFKSMHLLNNNSKILLDLSRVIKIMEVFVFVGTGADPGFNAQERTNKTLTTGPFGNTCEADEVSPEVEAGVVAGLRCLQP